MIIFLLLYCSPMGYQWAQKNYDLFFLANMFFDHVSVLQSVSVYFTSDSKLANVI